MRAVSLSTLLLRYQVATQFEALRESWWTTVDAGRTQDEVAADVAAAAQAALERARSGAPLRRLW
jgi:hypothetical protein